jgi:hypothetical protein
MVGRVGREEEESVFDDSRMLYCDYRTYKTQTELIIEVLLKLTVLNYD